MRHSFSPIPFILLLFLPLLASCAQKEVYIVYFGEHKGDKALHEIEDHHNSYLLSVKQTEEEAKSSLLYSYKHSINGFAAELTAEEASRIEKLEGVVSVFKSHPRKYETHTTRSWQFVGLGVEENDDRPNKLASDNRFKVGTEFLKRANYGDGVIVGVLDSGVWPESRSFDDKGMGPIPESWKGICQTGTAFNSSLCNRKIIGARYYSKGYERAYGPFNATAEKIDFLSPRDPDGHGSHTASTAVGRRVRGASAIGGFAFGTASGGAPLARLAVYKACWAVPNKEKIEGNTCLEEDMLAAIDDAIADGVHILSASIGTTEPVDYTEDGIAIGALHAIRNNIVVVTSAGNSGPGPGTLSNPAPWLLTVGASSLDRAFVAGLILGNGLVIETQSVSSYKMNKTAPLVYAADVVVPGVAANESSQCMPNSLSPELVKGKVVLCMRGIGSRIGKGREVKRAGGAGLILGNALANGNDVPTDPHFLPAGGVTPSDAEKILNYIKTDKKPMALIKPGETVYRFQPAPFMTGFSSRGPNVVDPNILKPDITAPGLNILAAWSGFDSPTKIAEDHRVVEYNLFSGTSMSCPHVSGAAALLKAIHPQWSSAAIRSALMTTAWMTNDKKEPIQDSDGSSANPFALGSGHFRPTKAADPGLVYDASYIDYLLYLCSVGLTNIDPVFICPKNPPPGYNLNYPSIAIPNLNRTVTITRTVTNVGSDNQTSVYFFSAKPPLGVSVDSKPNILFFNRVGQKKQFTITVKPRKEEPEGEAQTSKYQFGWYTWTDGHHTVRSPIAVSLAN